MKLLLVTDAGTIVDSTSSFTPEEWRNLTPLGLHALLAELPTEVAE